jgi:hypothetical protein
MDLVKLLKLVQDFAYTQVPGLLPMLFVAAIPYQNVPLLPSTVMCCLSLTQQLLQPQVEQHWIDWFRLLCQVLQ